MHRHYQKLDATMIVHGGIFSVRSPSFRRTGELGATTATAADNQYALARFQDNTTATLLQHIFFLLYHQDDLLYGQRLLMEAAQDVRRITNSQEFAGNSDTPDV
ncbi:hypothetical protein [Effusibacillus consociatus]|uniref:Uncharacterized protein n=1 Tax=Effusibacillus consociatus TaxID=1117041 RepID=A0ABV9Q3E4_9BACL